MVGIGGRVEEIEDKVVGRVLDGADLLQDHALLTREFGLVEGRVGEDVGQDVEREPGVVGEEMRIIGGLLDAGRGVEVAAGRLDLLGERAGRAAARALEGHMLEQVRQALLVGGLVARAGSDPYAERGGFQMRHAVGDDAQPGGQGGDLDAHEAAFMARP